MRLLFATNLNGSVQEVTTITLSTFVFGDELTPINMVGVSITVAGVCDYPCYFMLLLTISQQVSGCSRITNTKRVLLGREDFTISMYFSVEMCLN